MFCKNCGNGIKDGAKFCGKCGTRVSVLMDAKKNDESNTYDDGEKLVYISNLVDVLKEVLNKKIETPSDESKVSVDAKESEKQVFNQVTSETSAFEQYLQLKKKMDTTKDIANAIDDNLVLGIPVVSALIFAFASYCLGFGFLGVIIGAIIGGIISFVFGNPIYKAILSVIPEEYTEKGRESIWKKLTAFEETTLDAIENGVVADVEERLHLPETGRFTIDERERILTSENDSIKSLEQYRETVEKVCLSKLIRCKMEALDVLKNELADLYSRNKNRYSTELCQALKSIIANEEVKQCQTNGNKESVGILLAFEEEMTEIRKKCDAENNSIVSENRELEKTYHILERTFHELQAKFVPKSFYSDTFRKTLKTCNAYFEVPILDRDFSAQEYDDLLKNMDLKIKELQTLYQTECEGAKKRWEHNVAVAADLLKKTETVCKNRNDVVYSYDLTSMERLLFSQIQNDAIKLDVEMIEKKIEELKKRREIERDAILKTIQNYETKIQRARELVKVYERTSDSQVLYEGFLKRRRVKG